VTDAEIDAFFGDLRDFLWRYPSWFDHRHLGELLKRIQSSGRAQVFPRAGQLHIIRDLAHHAQNLVAEKGIEKDKLQTHLGELQQIVRDVGRVCVRVGAGAAVPAGGGAAAAASAAATPEPAEALLGYRALGELIRAFPHYRRWRDMQRRANLFLAKTADFRRPLKWALRTLDALGARHQGGAPVGGSEAFATAAAHDASDASLMFLLSLHCGTDDPEAAVARVAAADAQAAQAAEAMPPVVRRLSSKSKTSLLSRIEADAEPAPVSLGDGVEVDDGDADDFESSLS